MAKFRVILGGYGTMYEGSNYMQAMAAFKRAQTASKMAGNEYQGQGAIVLHDGKIKHEYVGNSCKQESGLTGAALDRYIQRHYGHN